MKKVLSLLMASLVVFMMFGVSGGKVLAAPKPVVEDCGCPFEKVSGAEKNKVVSDLLKSEVFKNAKKQATEAGLKWRGADQIYIMKIQEGIPYAITVPFYTVDGDIVEYYFFNGELIGTSLDS